MTLYKGYRRTIFKAVSYSIALVFLGEIHAILELDAAEDMTLLSEAKLMLTELAVRSASAVTHSLSTKDEVGATVSAETPPLSPLRKVGGSAGTLSPPPGTESSHLAVHARGGICSRVDVLEPTCFNHSSLGVKAGAGLFGVIGGVLLEASVSVGSEVFPS